MNAVWYINGDLDELMAMGYADTYDDAGIEEQKKVIDHDKNIMLDCFSYYQVATILIGADSNIELIKSL